jgi:hypothetical protein
MRKTNPFFVTFLAFIIISTFTGCWSFYKNEYEGPMVRDEAYVPIYGVDTAGKTIKSLAPQPIVESGKIYVFGNNLFQVEKMKGVHIINYSDKAHPVKVGFIRSGGATEIAVKNGYLVVNNHADLVTVDISDFNNVKEVARVKNAFKTYHTDLWQYWQNQKPPEKGKYYVCPAVPAGEELIGWKLEKNVENASCYYYP